MGARGRTLAVLALAAAVELLSAMAASAATYDAYHVPVPRLSPPERLWVDSVVPMQGDFDGDGRADVALEVTRSGFNPGPTRIAFVDAAIPRGVARLKIDSLSTVQFGDREIPPRFVPVGDVNGDGLVDLGVSRGHLAWIVLGARGRTRVALRSRGGRVIRILGLAAAGGVAGYEHDVPILGLGDLDGDGRGEIAIGSPGSSPNGRGRAGSVYFLRGPRTGGHVDVRTETAITRLDGPSEGAGAGGALALVGDFDGDGADDLAVGGERAQPRFTYDVAWVTAFMGPSRDLGGDRDTMIDGIGSHFDVDLRRTGDFDGDGHADLGASGPEGRSYLIYGGPPGASVDAAAHGERVVTFTEDLGIPRIAGDVSGDGRSDLLAGDAVVFGGSSLPQEVGPREARALGWQLSVRGSLVPLGDRDGDDRVDLATLLDIGLRCWEGTRSVGFLRGTSTPPAPPAFSRSTGRGDRLVGSDRGDSIDGERGNDVLVGRRGADCLTGGGEDSFEGPDEFFRAPRPDRDHLIGGGGDDELVGGVQRDVLRGGRGADRLFGGSGRDVLLGGSGDDYLVGDDGGSALADRYRAGAGDDRVNAVDGGRQRIFCGPGHDRVQADPGDRTSGCERVSRDLLPG